MANKPRFGTFRHPYFSHKIVEPARSRAVSNSAIFAIPLKYFPNPTVSFPNRWSIKQQESPLKGQ